MSRLGLKASNLFTALLTIIAAHLSISAQATAKDSRQFAFKERADCLCQTGVGPKEQVPFFKAGCRIWFLQNKCQTTRIESIENPIQMPVSTGRVRIGYVGHWSNSRDLGAYFQDNLVPFLRANSTLKSVVYDNTACKAMNDPEFVQHWLQGLSQEFSGDVFIKGNQVNSIGLWDPFFWGKANLSAHVSSQTNEPRFPSCSQFLNRTCLDFVQGKQIGRCEGPNQKIIEIQCRVVNSEVHYISEFGEPKTDIIQESLWQPAEPN